VERIVELALGKYRGFNDRHLTEKLNEEEQIEFCREKIRQILRCEGIASPRKRRPNKHRSRRERRAAEEMMLQVDGSPHDWLEGRGPVLCLIGAIDDATGKVPRAFFEDAESSWAYFRLFCDIFKKYGLAVPAWSKALHRSSKPYVLSNGVPLGRTTPSVCKARFFNPNPLHKHHCRLT